MSHDIDGDPLNFHWQLSAKPATSLATLINPDTQTPNLTPDKPGPYTVELIVNDGLADSPADQVIINTKNSIPVANAGPDQPNKTVGMPVELDGSLSDDVDGDALTYIWSLLHQPVGSSAAIQPADQVKVKTTFTPDKAGDYVGQLIVNDGQANSDPDTALVTVTVAAPPVNTPPQITSTPVLTATVGSLYNYDVNASDTDTLAYSLTVFPTGMTINAQTGLITWTPGANQTGAPQSVTVSVTDGQDSVSQIFSITVAPVTVGLITVPDLVTLSRSAAETALHNAQLTVGTPSFIHNPATSGSVISQSPDAGTSVAEGTIVTLTVSLGLDIGLPPDPAIVAPKIDPTVSAMVSASTEFLYSGSNPIQTGVAPGTIEARRAAVLRGKVLAKDNTPLTGVTITVLNHPEFGQTLSRNDGQFDLAVNGGGSLVIAYTKAGYFKAQRQVSAPPQEFAIADDVILITADPQVSTVDLTSATPVQVARGTVQTDADGTRQATLLFPQGTQAHMVMPDGSTQSITHLSVRATEYTVGANGLQSMPAELPPASGYTYAVVFTADEAKAAGAKDVVFSTPLPFYIENFLNFPVGTPVPVGAYNIDQGHWDAYDNGRVIKILSITNGLAELDTTGKGTADNGAALGITDAERQQLASLYAVGQSLWRTPIPHFDWAWDLNSTPMPPPGSAQPNLSSPTPPQPEPGATPQCGSIIECENQTLGERLDVIGTPFSLNYRSDRSPDQVGRRTLNIQLSGASLPATCEGIVLEVEVAGRKFTETYPPTTNQNTLFTWDGKDAYDRIVQGTQHATVRVGYVYAANYALPPADVPAWMKTWDQIAFEPTIFSSPRLTGVTLWQIFSANFSTWDARGIGLGAWSLDVHHSYDPVGETLYLGNGHQRHPDIIKIVETVAGNGTWSSSGNGGPAIKATVGAINSVAAGADGTIYLSEDSSGLRKIGPDGIIDTVSYTGGPLPSIFLAAANDGSLYVSSGTRIYRIAQGAATLVAGNGGPVDANAIDGVPAIQVPLWSVIDVAVSTNGSVYLAEAGYNRILKIGTDGIMRIVAGNGNTNPSSLGDGGQAVNAGVVSPRAVTAGPDGSLYIAQSWPIPRVRRVGTDGIITTIAGGGNASANDGDGGPATQAKLTFVTDLAVAADGTVYIADQYRIRAVGPDGNIRAVAGNGKFGYDGDKMPATNATLAYPSALTLAPDGTLYFADINNLRVRKVASSMPGISGLSSYTIASEDGSEVYLFDANGRHQRTYHALTGAVRYEFGYDASGQLKTITDGDGNVTRVERDVLGKATAMIGPFGQRTTLALNTNGFLSSLTNPAGETYAMTYTADGLLTRFTDPLNNSSTMTYDNLGRLSRDSNAAGGFWAFDRIDTNTDFTVTKSSSLNRKTQYKVQRLATGDKQRTITPPDGTTDISTRGTNGTVDSHAADGSITTSTDGPDPRFGLQAPITANFQVKQPNGLTLTANETASAILSNPNDLFSLTTLTTTRQINGRTTTQNYDAATRTTLSTTPAGRLRNQVRR